MHDPQRNGLHVLSAIGGVIVAAFLLLGAWGHLQAVRPLVAEAIATEGNRVALLVPAVILAGSAGLNLALGVFVWRGMPWALNTVLVGTALALAYLFYLLAKGVPGHPVGAFTAVVASYFVLLAATRSGLTWPVGRN